LGISTFDAASTVIVRALSSRRQAILLLTFTRNSVPVRLERIHFEICTLESVDFYSLMVLLADNAHQLANAIFLEGSVLSLQGEHQILVLGRVEDDQLISARCYAYGSQL